MKIKNGMTLAEILIVMAIAGIIATFGIVTMQRYDKGVRYIYSNTYHSLDRALYNAYNHDNLPNPFDKEDVDNAGNVKQVTAAMGAKRLCDMLVEYITTYSTACSESGLADDTGNNLGSAKFIAHNGVTFYISKRLPERDDVEHKFFIVYADLNGDKLPNTIEYTPPKKDDKNPPRDPDIFAFAALDTGRVCPLGAPEVDLKFMQTRVMSNSLNNNNDDDNDDNAEESQEFLTTRFSSPSKPYYISKLEAWGPSALTDNDVIDENPYTYNNYVRTHINANSKIFKFKDNTSITTLYRNTKDLGLREDLGCESSDDNNCTIVIDKYVY